MGKSNFFPLRVIPHWKGRKHFNGSVMSFGCIHSPIGIKQQSFRFFTIICIMLNNNTPPKSCCGQITVKHWQNLPISYPKPVLLNINTSTKFVKSLDIYMLLSRNKNMGVSRADNSVEFYEICTLAIPNQSSTISIHIPSFVKIHWCLLKKSSGH